MLTIDVFPLDYAIHFMLSLVFNFVDFCFSFKQLRGSCLWQLFSVKTKSVKKNVEVVIVMKKMNEVEVTTEK